MWPRESSAVVPLRTLAFGSVEDGVWGVGWFPAPDRAGVLVLGVGERTEAFEARLEADGEDGDWHVQVADTVLCAVAEGEARTLPDPEAPAGFAQLCAVSGALVAGDEEPRALPGWRGEREADTAADRLDSVRQVSAWFPPDEGVTVIAFRPRRHRGHEQDAVSAVLMGGEETAPITDPRLSTTYSSAGRPTRVNLELWTDDPEQFPRRVAGEAVGHGAVHAVGGWVLRAELLRCHGRGREGTGVYLLARPA